MENSFQSNFQELILDILLALSFEVIQEPILFKNDRLIRPDFILKDHENEVIVEVKVYRTNIVNLASFRNAFNQIKSYATYIEGDSAGLLITSTFLNREIAESIKSEEGIEIWDRSILFALTEDFPELRTRLEKILLAGQQAGIGNIYQGQQTISSYVPKSVFQNRIKQKTQPVTQGQDICQELENIDPGKSSSSLFENKCEEAVKYLFEDDMTFWQSQITTHDQLHRFDLIARIASLHDLWRTLARDFNSRYVVFEFKNYTDPITQKEVYSTEKYLFKTALRSIAIIISRNGSDKHAKVAMQGSLREAGKLIFDLDLEDLCEMLTLKDNGDDPNTFLSDKLDRILMLLSR